MVRKAKVGSSDEPTVNERLREFAREVTDDSHNFKVCTSCERLLPIREFRRKKGRLHSFCKSCSCDIQAFLRAMKKTGGS